MASWLVARSIRRGGKGGACARVRGGRKIASHANVVCCYLDVSGVLRYSRNSLSWRVQWCTKTLANELFTKSSCCDRAFSVLVGQNGMIEHGIMHLPHKNFWFYTATIQNAKLVW